jgi:dihydrofolate reductase
MIISAIVAMAKNNVIGRENEIPWYLPEDFKWFKKHTLNHTIIMGRKCFESIGRPLPKRTNIIVSRDIFFLVSGCMVVYDLKEAIEVARLEGETELFIIGGGEIYRQSMHLLDKLYITHVDATVDGDVFFPKYDENDWNQVFEEKHLKDEKNEFDYTFTILEKKGGRG